jgi:hypothetical protein
MEKFVRSQNVERYRRLIESIREDGSLTAETRRQTILKLLAEEQQKQRDAGDLVRYAAATETRAASAD